MMVNVCDALGTHLRFIEGGSPECGDYCDQCGDCLHCSLTELCEDGCSWVMYEGRNSARITELEAAYPNPYA